MKKRRKFTPVEEVIDPGDTSILWHYIPGFNGYEISFELNRVRSMKHFRKYPYGLLLQERENSDPANPTYELFNNNNERIAVRLSQLIYLAKTNPWGVTGYPRTTNIMDTASRNQRCTIIRKSNIPTIQNTYLYPKFTILPDEDDPRRYPIPPVVEVPIESTDGSTYYGREDCRTIFPGNVY